MTMTQVEIKAILQAARARDELRARIRDLGFALCGRSTEDRDWVFITLRRAGAVSFNGLKAKDGEALAALLAAMEKRVKAKKEDEGQ